MEAFDGIEHKSGIGRIDWIGAYFEGSESDSSAVVRATMEKLASHTHWQSGRLSANHSVSGLGLGEMRRADSYHSLERSIFLLKDSPGYYRLVVKGSGCDLLAVLLSFNLYDEAAWCETLKWFSSVGWTFTRIDVALDDQGGLLSMKKLQEYSWSQDGSRSKERGGVLIHQALAGDGILYGVKRGTTALSELGIRVYPQLPPTKNGKRIVRVELEAKKRRAREVASILFESGFDGVRALILKCVSFRDAAPRRPSKPDSWPMCDWWVEFLKGVSKTSLPLYTKRATSYEKALKGLEHSYGKRLWGLLNSQEGVQQLSEILRRSKQRIQSGDLVEIEMYLQRKAFSVEYDEEEFDAGNVVSALATIVGPWMYLLYKADEEGIGAVANLIKLSRQIAERQGMSLAKDQEGKLVLKSHFIEDRAATVNDSRNAVRRPGISIQVDKHVPKSGDSV